MTIYINAPSPAAEPMLMWTDGDEGALHKFATQISKDPRIRQYYLSIKWFKAYRLTREEHENARKAGAAEVSFEAYWQSKRDSLRSNNAT